MSHQVFFFSRHGLILGGFPSSSFSLPLPLLLFLLNSPGPKPPPGSRTLSFDVNDLLLLFLLHSYLYLRVLLLAVPLISYIYPRPSSSTPHALDLYHAYIRALVLKALRPPALYPFPTPTIPHPPLTTQGTLRQCSRGAIRLFPRTLLPTSLYYPCLCSPRSCAAVAKSRHQSRAAAGELPKLEVSCRASLSHHLTSISRHDTVDQRQSGDVRRFG